ncbi:hypothetical protein [Aquimarina sp. 2201CG5-10]|uniref:hypothetical protein n=1 Tax=Aquimarina callyspongiae TaxID=3098150 RepID=UPI002AB41F1E|nr:hypothetical protein [Aquimarina sp. 2201CG5-10]MDY8138322.1 hypothetical protein [Aquimarina sp. 2201CG5-10]
MNKLLLTLSTIITMFCLNTGHSQHTKSDLHFFFLESEVDNEDKHFSIEKKVFSYSFLKNTFEEHHFENRFILDHDTLHELSLIDIISSDEGADFNCSGGFCMTKSHFHKKGLTLKKQFFDYFKNIAC